MRRANRSRPVVARLLAFALLSGAVCSLQVAGASAAPKLGPQEQQSRATADTKSHPSSASGQLESFSVERTGLGDQEGSSSWKKMNKRDWSVKIGQPLVDLGNNQAGPSRSATIYKSARVQEHGPAEASNFAGRPPIFAIETPNPSELRPILIARRTAEILNPRDPSEATLEGPEVSSMNQARQLVASALQSSYPAEFGSRLSFLTTRKMEPDEQSEQQRPGVDQQEDERSHVVALMDLDTNYLPRIARARFM